MTCIPGFILDGSACVPESCGTSRWGKPPIDDDTMVYDAEMDEALVRLERAMERVE